MNALTLIIKEAKKIRKQFPKRFATWKEYVSQASAIYAKKHGAKSPVGKKKKSVGEMHKDNKSHNVNIRVVSGIKINYKKPTIGALPVGFTGNVLGLPFRVYIQHELTGGVVAQVVENRPEGYLITEIKGKSGEVDSAVGRFVKTIGNNYNELREADKKATQQRLKKFFQNLSSEVKAYNSGKNTKTKKGGRLTIEKTKSVKKAGVKEKIKDVLRSDKKRLKYGYTIVPGRVIGKVDRKTGYIGKIIIKKFTISELKKINPIYFAKGNDKMFGVYKRKLMISPKLGFQVMIEAHKNIFGGQIFREYTIRNISPEGKIESPKRFENLLEASAHIGKNIIL